MLISRKIVAYGLTMVVLGVISQAYAEEKKEKIYIKPLPIYKHNNISASLPGVYVDGNLRSYTFLRESSRHGVPDRNAFSLGGKINVLTDPFFCGFKLGATYYTAQSLDINSDNPQHVDFTLPGKNLTVLGQAYLQYQNPYLLGRAGNFLVTTPWVNEADSRMIPATYEGFYGKVTPVCNLDFIIMRLTAFKARISDVFNQTNLFTPSNRATPIPALANTHVPGTFAIGSQYNYKDFSVQAWDYKFFNFANLVYGDIKYIIPTGYCIQPVVGAQIGREWAQGSNLIEKIGRGTVHSSFYGVLLGAKVADGLFTVGFNNIPKHHGAFNNGDIVSPYTSGYISDPLYTTSMIAGLVEKAAGSAFKVAGSYYFYQHQILFLVSYAKYYTAPFIANTNETNVDVTFFPTGVFKNLSIRNRFGVLNGFRPTGRFVYNRVQIQYVFG